MTPALSVFVNSILSAALTSLVMTYVNTGHLAWSVWSANWFITWLIVVNYFMFLAPWLRGLISQSPPD